MKRRDFLKRVCASAPAVIIAPNLSSALVPVEKGKICVHSATTLYIKEEMNYLCKCGETSNAIRLNSITDPCPVCGRRYTYIIHNNTPTVQVYEGENNGGK